jgi:hypothetical protein
MAGTPSIYFDDYAGDYDYLHDLGWKILSKHGWD